MRSLLPLLFLLAASACSVPVAVDLPEHDANQMIVALEASGVVAEKELDANAEGRWQVSVAREDASAAVGVLSHENLPRRAAPGIIDSLGESGLVPSRSAEHARLVAGTAAELERSLRQIDGIISARVHLAVQARDPLAISGEGATPPTASVLLRFRGATVPIAREEVARLIAGAIPELDPARVAVVADAVPTPPRPAERQLARFGPVTATRASMTPLRLIVGLAALLNVGLLGLLLGLWSRSRRVESELEALRATLPAAPEA